MIGCPEGQNDGFGFRSEEGSKQYGFVFLRVVGSVLPFFTYLSRAAFSVGNPQLSIFVPTSYVTSKPAY
jgi:hypothetical protein